MNNNRSYFKRISEHVNLAPRKKPWTEQRGAAQFTVMWRTSRHAADSSGARIPEETRTARMMVDAARDGNLDLVVRLLDAGVKPDAGHFTGYTALGLAVNRGHESVAKVPPEAGIVPRLSNHVARLSRAGRASPGAVDFCRHY